MTHAAISRARLSQLRTAVASAGLDALLITPGPDLRWLTGYDALPLERLTCLVVPAGVEPYLVAPVLEVPAARASPVSQLGVEIVGWPETGDPYEVLAARLAAPPARVGVEDRMWAEQVLAFRALWPAAEQSLASQVLAPLRIRKDPDEADALRGAAQAIDRVHMRMGEFLKVGRTEREVGRLISAAIIEEGHKKVDFVIVASGPNSASPHHEVSEREITPGDVVVVDIGGTNDAGYCSDSTRTYVMGDAPSDFKDYFDVLHAAQLAACDHARPGVAAESVDAAARRIIDEAGYGAAFMHRTGHGIGVETHEAPYIVAGNTSPLEPGMAFSIEPGIYLSGRHGARIEDIVVVNDGGTERLNTIDRQYVNLEG